MARIRRGGYRMWATTDRCAADFDLRHVRKSIAAGEITLAKATASLATTTDAREITRLERRIAVGTWALGVARENEQQLVEKLSGMYPASGARKVGSR